MGSRTATLGDTMEPIQLGERIMQMLDQGRQTATYKYAVMLAILDLVLEKNIQTATGATIQTPELARKVADLYWNHCLEYEDHGSVQILRQNTGGQAKIVSSLVTLRQQLGSPSFTFARAWQTDNRACARTLQAIETELIKNPLPRLQEFAGQQQRFLFEISWSTNDVPPLRDYFRGQKSTFDNTIRLLPGVAESMQRLNGLLRPYLYSQWTRLVADINQLPEARLEQFLFGLSREQVSKLRHELAQVQNGRCMYTGAKIDGRADVDHFIPWARYPNNGIFNLVVATPQANNNKRASLVTDQHLSRWIEHTTVHRERLLDIAQQYQWTVDEEKSYNVAKSLYGKLSANELLWAGINQFERANVPAIQRILQDI